MSNPSQNNSPNQLIHETSPYLRQHAYNPVDWLPWGNEALQKAKEENKPILLSIGYSSCHWCHVMAHESFENDTTASLMNTNFVNIKLDREERPDIDQVYMEAVQNMGLRGGWPLNVFLTPDQKPFYGGTYFPPDQWRKLLLSVAEAYEKNRDKLLESADRFAESIQESEISKYGLNQQAQKIDKQDFIKSYQILQKRFDTTWGGINKAPKFPMPAVWEFLAHYSYLHQDEEAKKHLLFTLDKIAAGGIYDQIGGGFSRYSVDEEWHVPHFEKMLYDNGQLMSLYATGFKISRQKRYLEVMVQTAEWLQREMTNEDGGFYSALDADSEGIEGKFYVWSFEEVKALAGNDFSIVAEYYDVSKEGNWEHTNVLRRVESDEDLAGELNMEQETLETAIRKFNEKALKKRNERTRPGLDDKIISGWNGLMLTGLCNAYQATKNELFLNLARKNASFIQNKLITKSGLLLRIYNGETLGFLEDYAAVIQGFITYYETTFDEKGLFLAKELTDRLIVEFYDEKEGFFYFSKLGTEALIARKKELFDNVIPSSNSIMANNLYKLGLMFDDHTFKEIAGNMVKRVMPKIVQEPEYLSNWALTAMMMSAPTAEVVIVGDKARAFADSIQHGYLPNKIVLGKGENSEQLPLLANKQTTDNQTTCYVCFDKTCRKPVTEVQSALKEINLSVN